MVTVDQGEKAAEAGDFSVNNRADVNKEGSQCPVRNTIDQFHGHDHPDLKPPKLSTEQQISLYSFLYFWGTISVYTLLGAWIFQLIERQPELNHLNATSQIVNAARTTLVRRIEAISCSKTNDNLLAAVRDYERVLDDVVQGELLIYIRGTNVSVADTKWGAFPRAFSFVVTTITTIGYGNISPKTPGGRAFCIVYALIGIPLMLIAISKTGKAFALFWSRTYRRICGHRLDWRYLHSKDPTNIQLMVGTSVSVSGALVVLFVYMAVGAVMYALAEEWTFLDSFYFCFITLTTIGLGDLTPHVGTTPSIFALTRSVYILVGLAITSTSIELVRKQYTIWNRPWKRTLEIGSAKVKAAVEECKVAKAHKNASARALEERMGT